MAKGYYTAPWQVAVLQRFIGRELAGVSMEPCAGRGDIARHFPGMVANDIREQRGGEGEDARTLGWWYQAMEVQWVITNPPYHRPVCFEIVREAVEHVPNVAMLLRLSFLEPTKERGEWLAQHPPSGLIVMNRHSYSGDGKTDSVTGAWMVWGGAVQGVHVVPGKEHEEME